MTTIDMKNWPIRHEWKRRGKGFLVMVSRHSGVHDEDIGPYRWCVYAYLYPNHPHFAEFDGDRIWQPAALAMPFHFGATLVSYHYSAKDGNYSVTSVQVGADYNHLHDGRFTHMETPDDARQVFSDAEELFSWLQSKSKSEQVPA
jgi:hypothetical protein